MYNDVAFVHKLIDGTLSSILYKILMEDKFYKISAFNSRSNHAFLVPTTMYAILKWFVLPGFQN